MDKITICQDCGKDINYKTKKPNLCKECHDSKFGDRKFYKRNTITKSKGEFTLNKVLNEMFPIASYVDGGYYSFLKSPKGYPMQLDRYYPRLHIAFEFNGKQHNSDNDYFYANEEQFNYQQQCDDLKQELCEKLNIKIIRVDHDETITKELIIDKLMEVNMLEFILSKTPIAIE